MYPLGGADLTVAATSTTEVLVQTSVQGPDLQDARATRVSPSTVQVSVKATGLTVPAGALSVTLAGGQSSTAMTAAADGTYSAQVAAPAGQVNRFVVQLASTTPRVATVEEVAPAQSVTVAFPEAASLTREASSSDRDLTIPMRLDTSAAGDAGSAHVSVDLDVNGTTVPVQYVTDLAQGTTWTSLTLLKSDLDAAGISGDLTITPQRVLVTSAPRNGDIRPLTDQTGFPALPVVSVAEATTIPDNVPPVANATAAVNGMTVSFDGTASTDTDGLVTGYAWDFGDGTTSAFTSTSTSTQTIQTAQGTVQHTYAAAGTYPVVLQVSDVDGGTAQTSLTVTVGEGPAVPVLAADAFLRTTTSGWGSADAGGPWTAAAEAAGSYSTASGAARMLLDAPGAQRSAQLASVSSSDTDARVTFASDKAATGEGLSASLTGRQVPGVGSYSATTALAADGSATLALVRQGNGAAASTAASGSDTSGNASAGTAGAAGSGAVTLASSAVTALTHTPGQELRMRAQVVGTHPTKLAAKVWPAGSAEPAEWQVTATDATEALQARGALALGAGLGASATNAPVAVTFSHLSATGTGAPVNKAPVAAFAATPTGLTVALDASASSDADGAVASYAWAFGDGTTSAASTTATASHTYTAAGTYPVTLTITDDKGATTTAAKDVVVTAPAPAPATPTTLLKDTFTRTTTSGWGSAEEGGTWTPTSGAASFTTDGATGKITIGAAGQTRSIYATSVSVTDADVSATYSLDKLSDGANYVYVYGRRLSANDDYRTSMRIGADGRVTLALSKTAAGSGATLKSVAVPNLTYTAGRALRVRLQVVGSGTTTLRAKVWPAGTTEPADWQASATDATEALQGPGSIGLGASGGRQSRHVSP